MSQQLMQSRVLAPHEIAGQQTFRQSSDSSLWISAWLHAPLFWDERRRQRRRLGELAELDDYLLRDIGVTREQAMREARRPFWR